MYIPSHFKNDNIDEIKKFIQANSFGILIGAGETKIIASHIPLELYTNEAGEDVLYGHISKANTQWKNFEKNRDVLVIFSGQHTYILYCRACLWNNQNNRRRYTFRFT
jgi:transcriptional regulator